MKHRIRFTACFIILFSDAAHGVANPFNIPVGDTIIHLSSSETAHSILEGDAAQGDDGDFSAYEASGVGGRIDPTERQAAATVPAVRAWGNVSLLQESARPAAAKAKVSGCFGLLNFLGGRIDGVKVALWGCIAALILVLAVSACFLSMQYRQHSRLRDTASKPSADNAMVAPRSRRGASHGGPGSVSSFGFNPSVQRSTAMSLATVTSDAVSSSGQTSAGAAAALPGLPLCPLLIVPDGTRLACIVQNDVRCCRQELSFDIGAVPARGGAPLFRVRVSELSGEGPGIYVETLSGREQLAVLSTEELWKGTERPSLSISRPWGLPYGMIRKDEKGDYLVTRGPTTLLIFAGDFASHSVRVMNASENTVATAMQTAPEEYQVHMQARTDAGLIILGLLAIDKCEMALEPDRQKSGAARSEVAQQPS